MKAILSNINMELLDIFREDVFYTGYNQYISVILDRNSILYDNKINEILLFLDYEELYRQIYYNNSGNIFDGCFEMLSTILNAVEILMNKRNDAVFIMNNIVLPQFHSTGYSNLFSENNIPFLESRSNSFLFEFKKKFSNFIIMDWRKIVIKYGYKFLVDDRYWYSGRTKYNLKCSKLIRKEYEILLKAYNDQTKKVLVLDLDNTLWGGILGEDGVFGISISEDGAGKSYRDFQLLVKALKDIGILLCICSKNNEDDVKEVFSKNQMMILKYDDFIIKKINWNNKAQNISEIVKELNVGANSAVFIDDSPVEREIVKTNIPDVAVVDFPEDPSDIYRWFLEDIIPDYFGKINITREDLEKSSQYAANIERKKYLAESNYNIDSFIKSLQVKLKLLIDPVDYKQRLSQLTQKTNQFNMTHMRLTVSEIEALILDKSSIVFALDYEDKFGKEGIIALSVIKKYDGKAEIENFLMSCRTLGRNVEYVFLLNIIDYLFENKINFIRSYYIPTDKNMVASDFYVNSGILRIDEASYAGNITDIKNHLGLKYKTSIEAMDCEIIR